MEKFFKIKARGSSVRTEIVGGLVTFFSMAYIIFVNPNILCNVMPKENWTAVMLATCLSAALGTFLTAFIANVPYAQAPGMGLNAFFTYSVCLGMGYTWQQGLAIVLISGLIFTAVTISPLRTKIIASIPTDLKNAISAGIGLFIAFVGLLNVKLVSFAAGVPSLNFKDNPAGLLALVGLIIIGLLLAFKVKGAIFIGIIITTLIGIPMGLTVYTPMPFSFGEISKTFMKMDFHGLLTLGLMPLITAIISFALVDMFDTVGTLIGTAGNAGMLDADGNLPDGDKALLADAIATCTGACLGTSTVTTFVESSTGIEEGARTGLSSVVVGILFLLSTFLAPVAGLIPSAATAPALIIVGVFMLRSAGKINWGDFEVALPCFLTIAMMPFAYSISDGIGFGFISFTIIKMVRGKFKEIPALMYILSALFIVKYVLGNL